MASLGFGTCGDQCPWRGGANENTVFTTSTTSRCRASPCRPAPTASTSFQARTSGRSSSRRTRPPGGASSTTPRRTRCASRRSREPSEYHEVLAYEFLERRGHDKATLALKWENLAVPVAMTVDDVDQALRRDHAARAPLGPGFSWQELGQTAAKFCLQDKTDLTVGLHWAQGGRGRGADRRTSPPSHPRPAPGGERPGRGGAQDHGPRPQPPHGDGR